MTAGNDVAAVLDDVAHFVRRFVLLDQAQLTAVSLWVFHSHSFEAANRTPYLSISSAVMESGKTRLLEVLELLVARPWFTDRATAAVLARKIDNETPTLLLDESDAAFNGDREYAEVLRGVLNSGHRRGGKSSLCVAKGKDISYVDLSTFCPKAISGIGKLPDTVASRAIAIRLKRKAPSEQVERFQSRDAPAAAEPIFQSLENLGAFFADRLSHARPDFPAALGDRAADSWEPLLAIAELAGVEWLDRARTAAVELSGRRTNSEDSHGVRLLADCQTAFGELDRLPSKDLIAALCADDEAPWLTWGKGQAISARSLARLLEPFGIRSRSIRLPDDSTPKGYMREQFEDAWRRYLPLPFPPGLAATPPQPAPLSEKEAISFRHTEAAIALENGPNPALTETCGGVADRNSDYAGESEDEAVGAEELDWR